MSKNTLNDLSVFLVGDRRYRVSRVCIRSSVIIPGASGPRGVSVHDIGKCPFPVGSARRCQEIGAHLFGEGEGSGAETSLRMRLSEQHERAHAV